MKITNKLGLPDAVVRAVMNDPYDKGTADFSVTELIAPARQRALMLMHADEIEDDAADRLAAMYGQLIHLLLERANVEALAEKRFYGRVGDSTVSAQVDSLLVVDGVLTDWKLTSAYAFQDGVPPKPEWVMQLNFQAELLRQNGYVVNRLQIGGLLKDYSKEKAERGGGYPKTPVVLLPIPLWSDEETREVMRARVNAHREAREGLLPACTAEERWERPGQWAVMKPGQKRAVKLFDTKEEAAAFAEGTPNTVVERPGESIRCKSYCSVKKFCAQASILVDKKDKLE